MTHPQWRLTDRQIADAAKKDFDYFKTDEESWILKRTSDAARIWPHIDGFISCFIRKGMYVKLKKYIDLNSALYRQFSD